jgi:Na+/H+ antiporter NhaD/arsenite permease-like protein
MRKQIHFLFAETKRRKGLRVPLIEHAFFATILDTAYSGDCDRLFRSNVTAHSGGSALGGLLTPIGHVASTFAVFRALRSTRITG